MITGPADSIRSAVADEPGIIFRVIPRKDYPGGSYNTSIYTQADISGQTLTPSNLPGRVYLELQLSAWGSSPTGNGFLRIWETYVDASSYKNGQGSPLIPAAQPCTLDAQCPPAFGSPISNSNVGYCGGGGATPGRCAYAFVNKTRSDGIQFSVPCGTSIWEAGNLTNVAGHNFFGVVDSEVAPGAHCGLADPGVAKYAGAFALDARLGSFGTYTIGLQAVNTTALDDTAPDPVAMTVAAIIPAIIHIPALIPCETGADCDDHYECTADVCSSGICSNPVLPEGTPCGESVGQCDEPDFCDGNGYCDQGYKDSKDPACRPAAGDCDTPEFCTGNSSFCPPDNVRDESTACRPAAGACDLDEFCDSQSPLCPADLLRSSGTICRPSGGACDVAESCNGSSAACPNDLVRPSGVLCRFSQGPCDVIEACDGSAKQCPANQFRGTSFVCRTAANQCDRADTCDGASAQCPPDAPQPDGTACLGDGDSCTQDWCLAGVCESTDDCSCAAAPACGDGCCAIGNERLSTCPADCDDLQSVAGLFACVRAEPHSQGSPCLAFDVDGDDKITRLDYRIFVERYFGGP